MTYEEFIEQLKKQAHEELGYPLEGMKFYPEGFTSDNPIMKEWIKDSNLKFIGTESETLLMDIITMDIPNTGNVSNVQRIAVKKMYENAQENGFDAAFQKIRDLQKDAVNANIDLDRLEARGKSDYERLEDQLILRPLNYRLHMLDLKGCIYRRINDFVLCLYQVISDDGHNLLTSKIKRDEIENWRISEDDVMQSALENTARLYPAVVFDQRTQKEEKLMEKEFTRADITTQAPHGKMILLSSTRTTNGAAALFYPGVMQKLIKIMGGPFQAVFMNTDDVLIFDKNDSRATGFARTAKEGSMMGEMLSGKPYLCDGKQIIPGIIVNLYADGKAEIDND